jgi:hypothetical protein
MDAFATQLGDTLASDCAEMVVGVEMRRNPRITMHFTPTSASWMSMVEIFFGIITRQAIRRATFTSVTDLIRAIRTYIDTYNIESKASSPDCPRLVSLGKDDRPTRLCPRATVRVTALTGRSKPSSANSSPPSPRSVLAGRSVPLCLI